MYVIDSANVNEALAVGVRIFLNGGEEIAPRGSRTLEWFEPVTTLYRRPWERVLLNATRDANPFFHFMEGLWMLAGRDDAAWIGQFNSTFIQFSDNGKTFHGAYGHRMRSLINTDRDQVETAIDMLKTDPDTRRVVIQLWNSVHDLGRDGKDVPCNTQIYLKIRNRKLNMLVTCRSNDMILGAYGANAVHFSMIHEYIAGRIGVPMGEYRQMSDSFHVYVDNPVWKRLVDCPPGYYDPYVSEPYWSGPHLVPMFPAYDRSTHNKFDTDLGYFMRVTEQEEGVGLERSEVLLMSAGFHTPFFNWVAAPMYRVWSLYKRDMLKEALKATGSIQAVDWKVACANWVERRIDRRAQT